MSNVRYQENGDNRLLRHVLTVVWDQKCHWCRHFKDYTDLQIDHVLPRTADEAERDRLRAAFNLADHYDVDEPYNLAPICGTCNREKSDADLTECGLVLTTLKKAQKLAPDVVRRVKRLAECPTSPVFSCRPPKST